MKALEEYKQKKFKTKNVVPDCREAEAYLSGLSEGWKVALEWIKKQDEELCPEIPESAIGQIIDEELEQ